MTRERLVRFIRYFNFLLENIFNLFESIRLLMNFSNFLMHHKLRLAMKSVFEYFLVFIDFDIFDDRQKEMDLREFGKEGKFLYYHFLVYMQEQLFHWYRKF